MSVSARTFPVDLALCACLMEEPAFRGVGWQSEWVARGLPSLFRAPLQKSSRLGLPRPPGGLPAATTPSRDTGKEASRWPTDRPTDPRLNSQPPSPLRLQGLLRWKLGVAGGSAPEVSRPFQRVHCCQLAPQPRRLETAVHVQVCRSASAGAKGGGGLPYILHSLRSSGTPEGGGILFIVLLTTPCFAPSAKRDTGRGADRTCKQSRG